MTLNGLYVSRCRLTDETHAAVSGLRGGSGGASASYCLVRHLKDSPSLSDASVNSPCVWIYWYKDRVWCRTLWCSLNPGWDVRASAVFSPWLCLRLVLSVFTLTRTSSHDIWHERSATCSRRLHAHMADALSLHPSLCHALSTQLFHLLFCLFVPPLILSLAVFLSLSLSLSLCRQ